jgi:Phytanoyl-CoA dioxygenase (PhyH)
MSFAGLKKVAAGLFNRDTRKTSFYRDLPDDFDHRTDARASVAREAQISPILIKELSEKFPELSGSIQQMTQSINEFSATGTTQQNGYYQFRSLYYQTNGLSNERITAALARIYPKQTLPGTIKSAAGDYSAADLSEILGQLRRDGVCRLKTKLPASFVAELQKNLKREASKNNGAGYNRVDDARTFYREPTLLECPELAQLSCDPLFYHVASQYLGLDPVLGFITAWISQPHANEGSTLSKSAQLFHVDMSNPSFLKVFIYLNDVNEKNGPHCLVPKTHREKPSALWHDGRISDAEMAEFYPESNWDYQIGEAGSIFFVDTKAFHKGVPLIEGERHLAQIYYIDTLFGEHVPLAAGTPKFRPDRFGAGIRDCSSRFLTRYALAQ